MSKALNSLTLPFRLLLRKAVHPNEPIIKGQLVEGIGIDITTEANGDIKLSPHVTADIFTKISVADDTAGFLNDKIEVVGLTKEIINPGDNEVLRLTNSAIGMPGGTTNNAAMRYDLATTDWIEHAKILLAQGADENSITIREQAYTTTPPRRQIYLRAKSTDVYTFEMYDDTKFIERYTDTSVTRVMLRSGSGYLNFLAQASMAVTGKIISWVYSGTEKFYVKRDGEIFSNTLTPGTVLIVNANKEIVSLPAGTPGQVLTIDAGGLPVWA